MMKWLLVIVAMCTLVVAQEKAKTPPHGVKVTNKASLKAKATAHSVTLTWTQGTVTGTGTVDGNGVYRQTGTSCTGALKVADSSPNAVTTYTDTAVTAGTQYAYMVTSKCSTCSNKESAFSACVQVTVPTDQGTVNPPSNLTVTGKQ